MQGRGVNRAARGAVVVALTALMGAAPGCGGSQKGMLAGDRRDAAPAAQTTTAGAAEVESESAAPAAEPSQQPPAPSADSPSEAAPMPGGGAGGDVGMQPDADPTLVVDSQQQELDQTWADLQSTLEMSAVDCDRAKDLRDTICDLSERICRISDRHPDHDGVGDRCDDGRERCEDARQDVGDECG